MKHGIHTSFTGPTKCDLNVNWFYPLADTLISIQVVNAVSLVCYTIYGSRTSKYEHYNHNPSIFQPNDEYVRKNNICMYINGALHSLDVLK